MNKVLGHLKTITTHKWVVMKECFKIGLYWQGIMHDMSKYGPAEFIQGCKNYQGTASPHLKERKRRGIRLRGFITKDVISIISNTGSITVWMIREW